MRINHTKLSVLSLALAAFVSSSLPMKFAAAQEKRARFPLDLNVDIEAENTGLSPSTPVIPNSDIKFSPKTGMRPQSLGSATTTGRNAMSPARLPEAYSCPLFENRPHTELLSAIDALTKEVKIANECSGAPSAKSLEENGKAIKENVINLEKMMQLQNPSDVSLKQIDQSVTAAITAVGNIGDVINNNDFLNSKCGRQTMSTGKALIALNDIINGIAPYALLAVSMKAAVTPALPYVVGAAVVTSGIVAANKMIDQNTLDMNIPEHRKAILLNTCQFTKVAKKVRFMQLAQSGKIEQVTQELEKSLDLYKIHFGQLDKELNSLLSYRESAYKKIQISEKQLIIDRSYMESVDSNFTNPADDFLACTIANELVNNAKDGRSFPTSVFLNLERVAEQGNRTSKIEAATMKSMHLNLMKKISLTSVHAFEDENELKTCALAGRSWMGSIHQAITNTVKVIDVAKAELENELSKNDQYSQWRLQFVKIEEQKATVKRIERAMEELAKDTSIIDRSELAQRMTTLKSGLFGSRSAWGFGHPPVLAWINHTKTMHDEAISAFVAGVNEVHKSSYSLTEAGQGKALRILPSGIMYVEPDVLEQSKKISKNLTNITIESLTPGSRENEITCQQLESAWLDWSAAIDHLGAIQFFCDMIDPVLDVKMDKDIVKACRGDIQLNGKIYERNLVDHSKVTLIQKGFRDEAALVSKKLKELQCPMPNISVMSN